MEKTEKKWYHSKTKWAALLIGIGPVLATIGAIVGGTIDFIPGMVKLSTEAGVVLAVFGVRDWNIINGIKNK